MAGNVSMIEVVRGELTEDRAAEIREFWSSLGPSEAESPPSDLEEVVCVAVADEGEITAVASVQKKETIPLVNRPFWVYRSWSTADAGDPSDALFDAAFEALEDEFEASETAPVGVCVMVTDRSQMERRPEAVWPDTHLMYAGYLDDDRQLRVRYFPRATIGPGVANSPRPEHAQASEYPLPDGYRIEPLARSAAISTDDVLAFWAREGVLPPAEAQRRAQEVQLVATDPGDSVVGVSTAYLQRVGRLGMNLWHYRTFVGEARRESNLAGALILSNLELLEHRFTSGEDIRGPGMIFVLENEGLKRHLNQAVWPATGFAFIGENQRGDPIRVRYFEGATVPPSRAAS